MLESFEKINELEELELSKLKDIHVSSNHEGYAVLKEEIENAGNELKNITEDLNEVWENIKKGETLNTMKLADIVLCSELLCLAAAQISAKANKFLENFKKD